MAGELLYNRKATVEIGLRGGEGRLYENLRVQFEVEKGSTSTPNPAKVKIFNLNADSRAFVEKKDLICRLRVGYEPPGDIGFTEILAIGDVKKAFSERKTPDWVTQFEIGDGEKAINEAFVNKNYDAGIDLDTVVRDVAGSLGKPISLVKGLKNKVFKNGLSVSGAAQSLLDGFTEEGDVEWSIQDDEVQILPKTGATDDEIYVLTPETGLLGSPIKREEGIEVNTLLIPKLRPGRRIQVISKDFNGVYRIRKVNFQGDNLEGPWNARTEAVEVNSATA